MKPIPSLTILSLLLAATCSLHAQPCQLVELEIVHLYDCTYTTYAADVTFQHNRPADSTYTVWRKVIPNGNMQRLGSFAYAQDTVTLGTLYKNASYAILVLDDNDPQCMLRDTIIPQDCPAPCMADMLMLNSTVRCHPETGDVELRFDFAMPPGEGGFLFDVFVDSIYLTDLWMAPWGEIMFPETLIGDTLTICQAGIPGCCQDFVVPECNLYVCQGISVGNAEPVSCQGQLAHYVIPIHPEPPGQGTTELAIFNEAGQWVDFASLAAGDTLADLFIPASSLARSYAVCDLFAPFPWCCSELLIPALSCDSLPVGTASLGGGDIRLFPNPVRESLHIDLAGFSPMHGPWAFRVIDSTGDLVMTGVLEQPGGTIEMASMPPGTYWVGVWLDDVRLGGSQVVKIR